MHLAGRPAYAYIDLVTYCITKKYHSKTPHVVTVLWLDSDDVVTILSPTSGTCGRLQNHVSVPPSAYFYNTNPTNSSNVQQNKWHHSTFDCLEHKLVKYIPLTHDKRV